MTENLYTEFEPVAISENTEVKVPVTSVIDHQVDCPSSMTVSPMATYTNQTLIDPSPFDQDASADLTEYHRLIQLVRDLPSTLFIDRLLMDYHQCESNLDKSRIMLFDVIRDSDDFPFDVNCELKRRVTRQGDSAATKLATDIYTLLAVIDGGDVACVKEMISSRKPSRLSSVTRQTIKTHSPCHSSNKCECEAELKILKETVISLQADMLLIKQRNAATENIRNNDFKLMQGSIDDLQTSVDGIKTDTVFPTALRDMKLDLLNHSEHLLLLQNNVINLKSVFNDFKSQVSAGSNSHAIPVPHTQTPECNTNTPITPPTLIPSTQTSVPIPVPNTGDTVLQSASVYEDILIAESHPPQQTELYSAVVNNQFNVNDTATSDHENDQLFGNLVIPTIVNTKSREPKKQYGHKHKKRGRTLREVNFGIINREMATSTGVNHRFSSGNPDVDTARSYADEADDFQKYVVRRPKRFYVGGFQSNITEPVIKSYIEKRGPKVSRVTIFRKPRYGNSVVIRVHIEDDENACYVTDDPCFWPEGVTCKPWVSYGSYKARHNDFVNDNPNSYNSNRFSQTSKYTRAEWGRVNYTDSNRYAALESDCDLDY